MEENGDCMSVKDLKANKAFHNDARVTELNEFFYNEFGQNPQFLVRVPGRVNIIGEHVDYCGYPVLPMAIDQSVLLAVSANDENSFLELRNIESNKYKNYKCNLASITIDLPACGNSPQWYQYYLCGVKGIYEAISNTNNDKPIGMNVAISGNIPPASGLSSSSALVCSAVLATAYVHKLKLERKRLASISANCERYIGTQGGGMDQAIAYLAEPGCVQLIEFHPELKATPIQLPANACFVVVNSLAEINKAATSDFNERVVECQISCRLIAKHVDIIEWRNMKQFIRLQDALNCTLKELETLAKRNLPQDIYSREEVCRELNVTDSELDKEFLTPNTLHMDKFKLRQRALHVIQESLRVHEFRQICERSANNYEKSTSVKENMRILSQLMRQSHQSLKDLYECSHSDLDRIVSISDEMGVGARLTGAGWGGCVVALCDSLETSEKYMDEMKTKYFAHLSSFKMKQHHQNNFIHVIFATSPCGGAEIFRY